MNSRNIPSEFTVMLFLPVFGDRAVGGAALVVSGGDDMPSSEDRTGLDRRGDGRVDIDDRLSDLLIY